MTDASPQCKNAKDTDLKLALTISLEETLTALKESFYDLADQQAWAFPIPVENNIAWIVMHSLDNLDDTTCGFITGERIRPTEWRWDLWECKPEERPKPGDDFPAVTEMLAYLKAIREKGLPALERLEEKALIEPSSPVPFKANRADFYMRTICHTNSHVRQIWLLRGLLGLGRQWPEQHWA